MKLKTFKTYDKIYIGNEFIKFFKFLVNIVKLGVVYIQSRIIL